MGRSNSKVEKFTVRGGYEYRFERIPGDEWTVARRLIHLGAWDHCGRVDANGFVDWNHQTEELSSLELYEIAERAGVPVNPAQRDRLTHRREL